MAKKSLFFKKREQEMDRKEDKSCLGLSQEISQKKEDKTSKHKCSVKHE